ncbi:hypothetical protein VNO78_25471 [Psophocarpus tetragonolobus]|uniref:Cytochrome P450 n=1 Tax=Psophocarpus tetragonolobus TaxID=3891 RepID=A0AAN9S769_PSOTE
MRGLHGRLKRICNDLDKFYEEVIDKHMDPNRKSMEKENIVDVLLQLKKQRSFSVDLTNDHIKADMLVAATDTRAATPVWAMTALLKNPSVMKKVQAEIRTLYMGMLSINRDSAAWKDPEEFLPKRFFNSTIDFRGQDFELIPFGTGRRMCPGMPMAFASLDLILANLLNSFDWELPEGMTEKDIHLKCCQELHNIRRILSMFWLNIKPRSSKMY